MKTTVAIVGYGYWGPNLLRNYMEIPGVSVKLVCERRRDALDRACLRYPSVAATTEFDEVLGDDEIDAVVIATPITTHYELAKAALLAGKHVFVEKPMTAAAGEAAELNDLADARGLTLMVGHTFVFSPPVRKVKEFIDSGELGDIHFISSARVNLGLHQKDVSVVWDLAPHDLSILYYWLGETASSVSVTGRSCIMSDNPDVAFVHLAFPSGIVASVEVSWLSPVKLRRTVVVGSDKMLLYDDTENVEKVKLYDHGVTYTEPVTFGQFQLSYRTGDILSPKLANAEPLFTEATHFLDCIQSGKRPITDGLAGLSVVASLEAAERSLRHGGCAEQVLVSLPTQSDQCVTKIPA